MSGRHGRPRGSALALLAACILSCWGCEPEDPSYNKTAAAADASRDADSSRVDLTSEEMPDLIAPVRDADRDGELDQGEALPPGVDVSVATFNLKLLFDERCDSGDCDAGDFEAVPDELTLNSRISRLQDAIERIDADVIVLQEIEKESLLDRLLEGKRAVYPGSEYGETGFAGSLDVAVIARGPLLEVVRHGDSTIFTQSGDAQRFARELLEVHVEIRGERVIVFGAHFISKRAQPSQSASYDARRWAEAHATAELAASAAKAHPEALVVVAGDLNDTPSSPPLKALESAGLIVPAQEVDPDVYYTHIYRDDPQIIDHIAYVPSSRVVVAPQSLEVIRDEGRSGLGDSDHAAPRQRFRIKEDR